jgi:TRAP-type C4-dicarboxylate transport system permease small subunit
MKTLESVHRAISALEELWAAAASMCLFAIMVIVVVDVALRYFFNAPLGWSYDLISLYLMVALFFLALSVTQRDDHHVRVDIVFRYVSPRIRHAMELAGCLLTVVVLLGIVYQGSVKFWISWQNNDVVAGAVPWPTWLSAVFVPLGVGLLVLRLVASACSLALAIAKGSATAIGVNERAPSETEL